MQPKNNPPPFLVYKRIGKEIRAEKALGYVLAQKFYL
jgi:hypothetical protein